MTGYSSARRWTCSWMEWERKRMLRTDFGDAVGLPDFFALPFQGFGLDMVHGKQNQGVGA